MSTCTNLQLPATDSQDLGQLDSFLLPSEPPDIRNWFSSYAYESPDLKTLGGLIEFDASGETLDEEGKSGKYGDSQPAAKADDALLAASKESPDEIKFNESDDSECSKSAAMVNELSESLSFSSEPPDIRNWFSSYLYESPPVDMTHEFSISDYKREDGKSCNVKMSCIQDNKDALAVNDAKEREESRNLAVVVRCNDTVIGTESDRQTVGKDVHNVALKPVPSVLGNLTSDKASDPTLSGQTTGNDDHGHVKMPGNKNTSNMQCSLTYKRHPMSINEKNGIGCLNGESVGRINTVKDTLEKKDLHEIVSPGTLVLTVPAGDYRERHTDRSRNGKENELPKNGFVSIRKKSSEAKATRRVKSVRNEVEAKMNHEKVAKIGRKALSEISNFGSTNMQEISGKWRCPQKNKPELGPPLKQLRLNQWFHRV